MAETINERLKWVEHQGVRILRIELHNLEAHEYARELRRVGDDIVAVAQDEKGPVLMLVDIKNTQTSTDVLAAYKEVRIKLEPYVKSLALTGIKGFRLHFVNFIRAGSQIDVKAIETEELAIKWLLSR